MSDTTFIYALCEPGTRTIRYIGKANDPERRLADHLRDSKNKRSYKENWIFSLISSGTKPELLILKEVNEAEWEDWERCYIRNAQMLGFNLTNFAEGGDGVSLPGEKNPCFGKYGPEHPAFGRVLSEEEREAIRQRFLGVPKTPQHRKKLSEANLGKKCLPRSVETCQRLSDALKGHEVSLETRNKISVANRGKIRTPEMRQRQSVLATGKKRGPYKKKGSHVL